MHSSAVSTLVVTTIPVELELQQAPDLASSWQLAKLVPRPARVPCMPTTDELNAHYDLLDQLQAMKDARVQADVQVGEKRTLKGKRR